MQNIEHIYVAVSRTMDMNSDAGGGTITYSCSAKAKVELHQCPALVWNETLAFCQDKISKEFERIEKGEAPKPSTGVFNEDYVPDFNPFLKS